MKSQSVDDFKAGMFLLDFVRVYPFKNCRVERGVQLISNVITFVLGSHSFPASWASREHSPPFLLSLTPHSRPLLLLRTHRAEKWHFACQKIQMECARNRKILFAFDQNWRRALQQEQKEGNQRTYRLPCDNGRKVREKSKCRTRR